jgi:hypothetical protein
MALPLLKSSAAGKLKRFGEFGFWAQTDNNNH